MPAPPIVDALDAGFHAAFGAVEPAGGRLLLALDVSTSMSMPISGVPLSCREATAAIALVTAATEARCEIAGLTNVGPAEHGLTPPAIKPRRRLDRAIRAVSNQRVVGWPDCSAPIRHALDEGLLVDTFVVYTNHRPFSRNARRGRVRHRGPEPRLGLRPGPVT